MNKHTINKPVEVFIETTFQLRIDGYKINQGEDDHFSNMKEIQKRINLYPEIVKTIKLLIEEKMPSYHDCIDNGEPECAWCIASALIAELNKE